jgi:uncharacterized protein
MTISMYQASVPVFVRMLTNLSAILDKAVHHAAQRKIEPSVLLGTRLFPDMFPLLRQVQLTADFAKGTAARLAGVEVPKFPDTETSFEDLKARIAKTIDFVKSFKPGQIDGSEEREITIPIGGQPHSFKGQAYLLHQAMPNFYFHAAATYAILRHCGVEVGKRDFLGPFDTI